MAGPLHRMLADTERMSQLATNLTNTRISSIRSTTENVALADSHPVV